MLADVFTGIKGVVLDMDGVLWKDTQPLGNLPAIFMRLQESGLKVTLATNNSTRTVDEYLEKIKSFGVMLQSWQIITSADATGYLLQKSYSQNKYVYVIGAESLKRVLEKYGFEPIEYNKNLDGNETIVVAGMDRNLTYEKLRHATLLIRRGSPFIGTNPDRTFPTPEGLVPGSGSILAALEAATGVNAVLAGKPESAMFDLAISRIDAEPHEILCIGDRLETDIAGGQKMGCKTALVLTGVTSAKEAQNWQPRPDAIADDISTLLGF